MFFAVPQVIIYFEATSETLTKRLLGRAASSGRADDNEETIKLRLKTFIDNNELVLAQYPDKLRRVCLLPIYWYIMILTHPLYISLRKYVPF